jgi:hypothetical protein
VTLHVRSNHSNGGGVNSVDEGRVGLYFSGERRIIEDGLFVDVTGSVAFAAGTGVGAGAGDNALFVFVATSPLVVLPSMVLSRGPSIGSSILRLNRFLMGNLCVSVIISP